MENAKYTHYYRGYKCNHFEREQVIPVFATGQYLATEKGKDNFSKDLIYFYKYGYPDLLNNFLNRFLDIYSFRFRTYDDINFDYVCLAPTHEEGKFNENMEILVKDFCEKTGLTYENGALRRMKTVNEQHLIKEKEKRYENVNGSIELNLNAKNKNILVFDNIATTGATADIIFDLLKRGGANKVFFYVIGLNGSKNFDLNPTLKQGANWVVEKFHGLKTSKEERLEYKKVQGISTDKSNPK